MRIIALALVALLCLVAEDAHARKKTLCLVQESGEIRIRRKCKEGETVFDAEAVSNLTQPTSEQSDGFSSVTREVSPAFECKGGVLGKDCFSTWCCPSGFTIVGGGAESQVDLEASYPSSNRCWYARTFAAPLTNIDYRIYALCAK